LQDQLAKADDAKTKAQQSLDKFKYQQIEAMIQSASQKAGTAFTDEDTKVYTKIGKSSGDEALAKVLAHTEKKPQSLSGRIAKGTAGGEARDDWSFDDWQKKDPQGLEKLSSENPGRFNKLFNTKYKK